MDIEDISAHIAISQYHNYKLFTIYSQIIHNLRSWIAINIDNPKLKTKFAIKLYENIIYTIIMVIISIIHYNLGYYLYLWIMCKNFSYLLELESTPS